MASLPQPATERPAWPKAVAGLLTGLGIWLFGAPIISNSLHFAIARWYVNANRGLHDFPSAWVRLLPVLVGSLLTVFVLFLGRKWHRYFRRTLLATACVAGGLTLLALGSLLLLEKRLERLNSLERQAVVQQLIELIAPFS